MSSCLQRLLVFPLLLLLTVLVACGGGGSPTVSVNLPTPPASTTKVVITSGDAQVGVGGMLLSNPLYVTVQDSNGAPVAGSAVSFSSSAGVDLLPSAVTTSNTGIAAAWVRLPAQSNAKFTVQASASTGGSATFNLSTAAKLAASFGDATTGCGAVAGDGTYYSAINQFTTGSPAIFNADGSLRSKLLPSAGSGKAPVEAGNRALSLRTRDSISKQRQPIQP